MGFKQWGCLAMAALAVGCASSREAAYLAPDYEARGVRTIAVLPVLNQAEWSNPAAHQPMVASLVSHLRDQKRYDVVAPEEVGRVLRGPAQDAYQRYMGAINRAEPAPAESIASLGKALRADALFQETIVSFHQFQEQSTGATMQGGTAFQTIPVSVVQLRGVLYGAGDGRELWRDEHLERVLHDPGRNWRADISPVIEKANVGLLGTLPVNTWAPAPADSP